MLGVSPPLSLACHSPQESPFFVGFGDDGRSPYLQAHDASDSFPVLNITGIVFAKSIVLFSKEANTKRAPLLLVTTLFSCRSIIIAMTRFPKRFPTVLAKGMLSSILSGSTDKDLVSS